MKYVVKVYDDDDELMARFETDDSQLLYSFCEWADYEGLTTYTYEKD